MAAAEQAEQPGNNLYQDEHMGAIFKEGFSFSGFERDHLALNLGDKTFLDVSGVSGLDSISDGRGAVFADLDNDGDTDVFLTAVQREAHYLFRNNVGSDRRSLRIELEGTSCGRDAFGTVVRVGTSSGVQTRIKSGGSGFVSSHDPRLLFGLGDDERAEWIEVTWPGGQVERFESPAAGTTLRIVEGRSDPVRVAEQPFSLVDPLTRSEAQIASIGLARAEEFPDLDLQTLDDRAVRLSGLVQPGRRSLVNLWATYCVPCAEEMPELQQLAPRLQQAGIDLVGISIDVETADQVEAYLEAKGIRYPVYTTGEESIPRVFSRGEVLIPTSVLLDDRLRVLEVFAGWSPESRNAVHALAGPAHSSGPPS